MNPVSVPIWVLVNGYIPVCCIGTIIYLHFPFSLFVFRFSVSLETSTTLLPPSLPSHMLEPVRHYIASMDRWALKGKGLPTAQFMFTMQTIKNELTVNIKVKKRLRELL